MIRALKTAIALLSLIVIGNAAAAFEGIDFNKKSLEQLKNTRADYTSIVGTTLIVKGNVYIPFGDLTVYADAAQIDFESGDAEVTGNIRAFRVVRTPATITIDQLLELRRNPFLTVVIEDYITDPLGQQQIQVTIIQRGDRLTARRLAGNINTGVVEFNDVDITFKGFAARAERAVRKPGGEITLEKAEVSSCSYLAEQNPHYSFFAEKIDVRPHETAPLGFSNYDRDLGEHSFWAYNVQMKFYGVPVLWMPVFYKPKDESPGLFKLQIGDNSDWGFYVLMSKKFTISDVPDSSVKLLFDYYNMRGFGYGADTNINTADSRTSIFAYGIYDIRPYYSSEVQTTSRLTIPNWRYDFRITNVTHVTPRLDFRGNFELLSDMYFLEDYYRYRFSNNPEPATYASLEYQFNRFSTALYVRPQVNSFFATVERLPELRLDVPRQQVLGSRVYYQSETSAGYMRMRWREFDLPPEYGTPDPKDYQAFRFDTVHFLYLPFKVGPVNFIPRAGGRLTAYSNSSKQKVDENDLNSMFVVNRPEGYYDLRYNQYDDKGGALARFVGEFGIEANTKFSRSYQEVRNAFWRLDGLRHVVEPYTNYTFIPDPSESRDHIYYFDDIDRIQSQNFVRLGLRNRLQTRRGNFGNEEIAEFMTMDNYWDIHMQDQDGFNNIGDFCTKLEFNPGNGLSVDTLLSLDVGGNSDHDAYAVRNGREAGRPGIGGSLLNFWEINLRYELFRDCNVSIGYLYQDAYATRSAYSMGSTLSEVSGGSYFDQVYTDRMQTVRFGFAVPLSLDHSFRGAYDIFYDFELGAIREQRIKLIKTLHCWEVALEAGVDRDYNSDGDKEYNYSFMATAYLTGLMGPAQQVQSALQQGFNDMRDYSSQDKGFNF